MKYVIVPAIRSEATHINNADGSTVYIFNVTDIVVDDSHTIIESIDDYTPINRVQEPVPTEIPLWAFRQVLEEDGLLSTIQSATSGNAIVKNYLEYGNIVLRGSQTLNTIATQLGKSESEIDQLFIRANRIVL